MSNFLFLNKNIKNLIFNKTKNAPVRFFIYMSSICVQLFTAFEEAVLKLYFTLVSALKSNMAAISVETNRGNFFFILIIKPATGRPFVRAFSLSGTVPAFMRDCLRFVCAFTRRRKFDLCVSIRLLEQCLRSEITSVSRVANVLLLLFVAGKAGHMSNLASLRFRVNAATERR